VGTIEAGQSVRRDLELRCLAVTPRACNRVTVTARGLVPLAEEACLEIIAAEAGQPQASAARAPLRVSVAETTDPVRVGGKTTYQILVENADSQSYFDVVVKAKLSRELRLESIAGPVRTASQPTADSVEFTAVRELRAGEAPLNFELHVVGSQAGAATVQAEVTYRDARQPVTAQAETQVVP
jgi:hypothetical protein